MPESLQITVVYSGGARGVKTVSLSVPLGATVAHAVRQCALLNDLNDNEIDQLTTGIRSRKVSLNQLLEEGDRIEICRPLKVDPKVARRQRFASQGAKSAGLFAKRRQGAKAGY
jgi:putative ubiquitin-RnfH superfamily antitoxin RatB of RatAB toxin-antitoxin module